MNLVNIMCKIVTGGCGPLWGGSRWFSPAILSVLFRIISVLGQTVRMTCFLPFWRSVLAPLSVLTCSPCRVWPASASRCAPAAAGRSRTATTCWPWTNSGTCAAWSAASANSTWSPSSPASARTVASTARRTTTGRTRGSTRSGVWLHALRREHVLKNVATVIYGDKLLKLIGTEYIEIIATQQPVKQQPTTFLELV